MKERTHQPTIADGPSNYAPGITLRTNLQWEDLGWVQPWYCKPSGTEDGSEKEHKEDCCSTETRFLSFGGVGGEL